jgi:hypothetical protein
MNRHQHAVQAAGQGDLEEVRRFLREGGDVNAMGEDRATPLYQAIKHGRDDIVEALLAGGADRDVALWCAAYHSDFDSAQRLIARGAGVEYANAGGWTPLHLAATRLGHETQESKMVMELLLNKGADVTVRTRDGRGVLDVAELEIKRTLLEVSTEPQRSSDCGAPVTLGLFLQRHMAQDPGMIHRVLRAGASTLKDLNPCRGDLPGERDRRRHPAGARPAGQRCGCRLGRQLRLHGPGPRSVRGATGHAAPASLFGCRAGGP